MNRWEELATGGKIEDAIAAYVQERDWVTFAELQNKFEAYIPTRGTHTLEIIPNGILWTMSDELTTAVQGLLDSKRLFLHPVETLVYLADGGMLDLPIAKRPKPEGYSTPHWFVAALRSVPFTEQTGKKRTSAKKKKPSSRRKLAR